MYPYLPGEWGLGDLAYISSTRVLTGRKHPKAGSQQRPWSQHDEYMRHLIAQYRARVETVIKRLKSHAWCGGPIFRGSSDLFHRLFEITVFMTALEIRRDFEIDKVVMFEVLGPWPHRFY